MAILRQIRRLQFIDYLIRRKATGNLNNFAQRNRMSKRGLSIILQEMREMGFPIKFSRQANTYYYEENGEMVKCLFNKYDNVLSREEMKNVDNLEKLCFSESSIFKPCQNP